MSMLFMTDIAKMIHIAVIIRLYEEGCSYSEISIRLSVARSTAHYTVKKWLWSHFVLRKK